MTRCDAAWPEPEPYPETPGWVDVMAGFLLAAALASATFEMMAGYDAHVAAQRQQAIIEQLQMDSFYCAPQPCRYNRRR